MTIREEMILKGTMGHNEFMLKEMAATHLVKVIKLIKAGDIEKAAQEYLDAGGVTGGVTRTVNHYMKNNPDQDNSNFDKFKAYFSEKRAKTPPKKDAEGKEIKRKYERKGAEEGKQGQRAAKKRLEKKVVQQYKSAKEFIDSIKNKTDTELKSEMKDAIEDLKAGKAHGEDKDLIKKLSSFYDKGENREEAIHALKQLLKSGLITIRDFGLWAEKPEAFITKDSKKRADDRVEKIRDKEKAKKKEGE